jgi:sugar lactone lactonase YvrE
MNCEPGGYDICISHDGSKLFYIAYRDQLEIFVANSTDGSHIQTLDTGGLLRSICISQDDKLFCAYKDENIKVMDLFGTHLRTIDVPGNFIPSRIHISHDRIFTLCTRENKYSYDYSFMEFLHDGEHIQTINLENIPYAMCVSQNRELFITYKNTTFRHVKVFQI